MLSHKNFEYDCTIKCRLKTHSNAITAALTKRSIKDEKLAAYVAKICCNFIDNVDDRGRSAVHIAASVNNYNILEWLLNQGAIISGHDYESGNTPLHRAIFYGCIDCAVLLLRYGASLDLLDDDHRTPLQCACRPCETFFKENNSYSNELLVWGLNKNYNLGISNDRNTEVSPQILDYFRKEQIPLESVALGVYHSLFLDKKGFIYVVGHGNGGRLGFGNEESITVPKKMTVKFKNCREVVICVSVSRKHSLILTKNSLVYACGLNDYQQLGVKNQSEKLLTFKEVVTLRDFCVKNLIRVIACDYYSLAYSMEFVYVWGTNVGQMGFEIEKKTIPLPKLMKLPTTTKIVMVEASNSAISILTVDNQILVFCNYKMKILKAPNYEALKKIAIVESNIVGSEKGTASALKLLILTQTNVVYLWYQLTQHFYRCSFTPGLKQIDKILYKCNQVLILSEGDVYRGKCQQVSMPSYYKDDVTRVSQNTPNIWNCNENRSLEISKDYMIRIDLSIIQNIDRVIDIYCNDDFTSFAALQESHIKYLEIPKIIMERYTFKKLLNDCTESDSIHDVVFNVDGDTYPAHKLIIYSRSRTLGDIITNYQNDTNTKRSNTNIDLNYLGITSKMFEIIMKFIYTNYLPNEAALLNDLKDIQSSINPDERPQNISDVLQWFINYVELFQLNNLAIYLKSYHHENRLVMNKSKLCFRPLCHTDYPEFHDLRIICENNTELFVHKCVLVARLEYFQLMFAHTWHEQSSVDLSTIPYEYVLSIIEFIYSMDVNEFRKKQYRETFLYNMIVYCDQFFIEQLREVCEILLLEKITIRKCGEMLDFACIYNCNRLKNGCLNYICHNISRVLLQKCLHSCQYETLKTINQHYRNMFKDIFDYRVITPDTMAINDECLLSFVDDFHINFDYKIHDNSEKKYACKNKLKVNDHKTIHCNTVSERHYERQAISTMMANLNIYAKEEKDKQKQRQRKLSENDKGMCSDPSTISKDNHKLWLKVTDKKDQKGKNANIGKSLKVQDALSIEGKPNTSYVNLKEVLKKSNDTKITNKTAAPTTSVIESSTKCVYNINFADLTLSSREKLSQKQRKRLLSDENRATSLEMNTWNVNHYSTELPSSSPSSLTSSGANTSVTVPPIRCDFSDSNKSSVIIETGSLTDPTSFANMIRNKSNESSNNNNNNRMESIDSVNASKSVEPSITKIVNNFSDIVADERRQRNNHKRMRHKSLVLTQIEEQAICELKDFYNVENVNDEIITIERKPQSPDNCINYPTWQRN